MPSPTPLQLVSALLGRTALIYLALLIASALVFGSSGAYFLGFFVSAIFGLFMYLRRHRFLVSGVSLSDDQSTVTVAGKWLELGFKPKEDVFPLSNLHKLELKTRQWYEDADELRIIKRTGMSVELKAIPGYVSEPQIEAVNRLLIASRAKPEAKADGPGAEK